MNAQRSQSFLHNVPKTLYTTLRSLTSTSTCSVSLRRTGSCWCRETSQRAARGSEGEREGEVSVWSSADRSSAGLCWAGLGVQSSLLCPSASPSSPTGSSPGEGLGAGVGAQPENKRFLNTELRRSENSSPQNSATLSEFHHSQENQPRAAPESH